MSGYYDLVLGLIPLALGGIVAGLTAAGFALTTAVPLASAVAVGLMGHAMFVRGPVESGAGTEPGARSGTEARGDGGYQSAD